MRIHFNYYFGGIEYLQLDGVLGIYFADTDVHWAELMNPYIKTLCPVYICMLLNSRCENKCLYRVHVQ